MVDLQKINDTIIKSHTVKTNHAKEYKNRIIPSADKLKIIFNLVHTTCSHGTFHIIIHVRTGGEES